MLSDLAVRVLSAVCLGVPFIFAVYAGSPYFDGFVLVAAVLLAWEWFRLASPAEASGQRGFWFIGCVVVCVIVAAFAPVWLALIAVVLAAGAVFVGLGRKGWLTFGVPYLALPCVALLWLRHTEFDDGLDGRVVIFWLLAVVWASDVGAYFTGRLIGGPKLAPAISPNKTWAGFAGGALAAALTGGVAISVIGAALERNSLWLFVLVSVTVGICAQGGDLLESWLKRHFGVKDTSQLIPGHGGVLDRVDGLMTAAVLSALIAALGKGSMF